MKNFKNIKRIFSFVLAFAMIFTVIPMNAQAMSMEELIDEVTAGTITDKQATEKAQMIIDEAGLVKVLAGQTYSYGGKLTADLSKTDMNNQIDVVTDAVSAMKKNFADNNINITKKLEAKITFELPVFAGTKEVEISLPDLEEAFESVYKVKIKSNIVDFELGEDTFNETDAKLIKLSASIVEASELTEEQRAALPAGVETLIDLNANIDGEKISDFRNPIEVSIPYALNDGEDAEKISVFLLNDDGIVERVAGKYDEMTGKISIMRNSFGVFYLTASTKTFADIADYSWAENEIEILAGKGIINGKSLDTFDPSAKITRAEFISLMSRMLEIKDNGEEIPFEDVDSNAWYGEDVAAAYQNGIISGKSMMKFAPMDTITREEVALVISNALRYKGIKGEMDNAIMMNAYSDARIVSNWADEAVSTVYREGIMQGYLNKFNPKGDITRAEAAVSVYRLYSAY